MLVGGESKLGSIEDEGIGGDPGCAAAQPRPIDHFNDDHEQPTLRRYAFNMHTEGSNGIYGLTREACWVREGVSHPPPGTECRCVHVAVLRLCLSFNVTLSLNHNLSHFLHWNLLGHCSELYHPAP